jgi:heptosyltransferase-2
VRPELFTTAADEAAADRAWDHLGLAPRERVVCLNTGGAYGPAKNWPLEYFVTLARRLATEGRHAVLVVCGPGERETARAIVAATDHPRVVSLAGLDLGIGLTKACVRRSSLLITTDSGPRHFAAAFKVPVLTLFGPTHIAWTRTYHPHAIHLRHPVPCGPCQRAACPLGHHNCMRELTPDSVFAAARRYL